MTMGEPAVIKNPNATNPNPKPKKKRDIGKISTVLCRISLFALAILGAASAISAVAGVSSSIVAASMGIGMLLLSVFFISIRNN